MTNFNLENYINKADDIKHSEIGASSAERWFNCPGSVNLSKKAPSRPPSKYAWEGTLAHRCAELLLNGKIESWELVGVKNVTSEMIECATFYADYIKQKILKSEGELLVEHSFHLKDLDKRAYGTADAVVINETELHVIDFKYGAGVIVNVGEEDASGIIVANNPQLLFYALGAYLTLTQKQKNKIEKITIWVIQPRATHASGIVRNASINVSDLTAFQTFLQTKMLATRDTMAPLQSGKWCRWCPAFLICPEQGRIQIAEAKLDFAETKIELPAARDLKPQVIAKILENKDILEAWFKDVYDYAKLQMENGVEIPGFKLVVSRTIKTWIDPEKALKFLRSRLGEGAVTTKIITPSQAKKLKVEIPESLVTESESSPVVAPVNDKRRSFTRKDAANDFLT